MTPPIGVYDMKVVLDRYPPEIRPIGGIEPLGASGGLSGAGFWRFHARTGTLLAKASPIGAEGLKSVATVHRWLAELSSLPVVPRIFATIDDLTCTIHHGRIWEVMEWKPGIADHFRPWPRARIVVAFATLGRAHRLLQHQEREGASRGWRDRFELVDRLARDRFEPLRRAVEHRNDEDALLARRWIERASPIVGRVRDALSSANSAGKRLQPCIRDARAEHFLWTGSELTGLVDFGAMGVDHVAGDLARLMGESLAGDPEAREVAFDAYQSFRPLTADDRLSVEILEDANALLLGERWIRWGLVERRTFADPNAVRSGLLRGLARVDERFGEA